jgi:large subunit ribosomal protein L2
MGTKSYKPRTPARRYYDVSDFQEITTDRPLKSLTSFTHRPAGRNNQGEITIRRRGGGHKRRFRIIDFKRIDKKGIPALVHSIEYDPNRTSRIALLYYNDGEKRYILAPLEIKVGDRLMAGPDVEIRPGNAMPIKNIPLGTMIHNIELKVGAGGQIVRTAGGAAQVLARDQGYVQIKLPSGEVRKVYDECYATIGQLGNIDNENRSVGKAGRMRWMGKRPRVRGVAMNPVDHPMGGGEGKTSGGRHPCSPLGIPAKGYKTRHNKSTEKYIVSRRKK